ncbi:MAG TPA: hypothetical protein VLV28_09360 [Gaiellaceae bacterium]|nr:hypothetical protein [Gaiellaceae bacterium]
MNGSSGRRLAAVGAVAVVVLWVIGFFLAGKPPAFDASSEKVVDYYANHHKQVLIAVLMVSIGIAIFLAVMAQLAVYLRSVGQPSLGAAALAGAAAIGGLFSVGAALYGVISQVVAMGGADPRLARALYQLDQFAGVPIYWLTLVIVVSVALAAHRRVFPDWALWLSAVLAVIVILGGVSVKATGAFAAGTGAFAGIGFAASMVFLLEVGVLLWTAKDPRAD